MCRRAGDTGNRRKALRRQMHYTPGVGAVSHRITGWLWRPDQDRGPHVHELLSRTRPKRKAQFLDKKKSFRSGPSSAAFWTAASPNCTQMVGTTMRRIPQGGRPARCRRARCSGRERPINKTTPLNGVDNYKHTRSCVLRTGGTIDLNAGTRSHIWSPTQGIHNLILPIAVHISTNQLATSGTRSGLCVKSGLLWVVGRFSLPDLT